MRKRNTSATKQKTEDTSAHDVDGNEYTHAIQGRPGPQVVGEERRGGLVVDRSQGGDVHQELVEEVRVVLGRGLVDALLWAGRESLSGRGCQEGGCHQLGPGSIPRFPVCGREQSRSLSLL